MKKYLLHIVLFFCITQQFYSQEDGVVAFNIPARNSLKFNKQFINPTFSFIREQNKYISFNNKREWAQFDNAPQTYLFGYSGRFRENIGAGLSLFQQDYGVLTTFGGVVNFAYNAVLNRDNNLTFGLNLGFYNSGLNKGNVVTNLPDSSLENVPSNSIISINPGLNYGTDFFDFGISLKNLVSYNFTTSKIIEENSEQSVQGHIMYTGYVNNRGFFDESKFSGLISSEFKKDETVISGMIMLMVPKGIWMQAGYNSLYAFSAGIGLNITSNIAIEYNYEKGVGGFSSFGNSHDITLAYKFKNNYRYDYSGDDDEEALLIPLKKKSKTVTKRRKPSKPKSLKKIKPVVSNNQDVNSDEINVSKVNNNEAVTKAKQVEPAKEKAEQEAQAKIAEATRVKAEAVAKAKEAARVKEKAKQEAQAKITEAERIKDEDQDKSTQDEDVKVVEDEKIAEIVLDEILIKFKKSVETSKKDQQELLNKLNEKVANKQQNLDDLKEENDLSEKGIVSTPKPFKSVSAENAEIESLKLKIDNSIITANTKITEIETLYRKRLKKVKDKSDAVNIAYSNTIKELKSEQLQAQRKRQNLILSLNDIKLATDFEKRRRIKRATYDNIEDRYNKDRATLERIKKFTEPTTTPLTKDDFDYGEELSNIQIVKDIDNVDSGYYLVIAVHNDVTKRDKFLENAVSVGQENINFFFDVNTSKYYIYYEKFDNIGQAKNSLDANKGNAAYNSKMSIVKIEN